MRSTFQGLEVARRGMMTQQAALHTTGHNIANANTPGYTRQRVNFAQTEPYPAVGMNRPNIPGQMGTGVQAQDIQRIRDSFVDMQYRSENSKLGYWQARTEQLTQMEDIMNEPSDTGLANTLDQFWNSLQDLSVQPQNTGARRVVRQRGIAVANTFNYTHSSLKAIQKNYRSELDVSEKRVNSVLRQISQVNKQIGSIEPHGYLPNDLYDERDRLIDELSTMMNIKVEPKASGGNASPIAEGKYDVFLANSQGDTLLDKDGKPIKLIDSQTGEAIGIHLQYENRPNLDSPISTIKFFQLNENEQGFVGLATQTDADDSTSPVYQLTNFSDFNTNGKLKGYIEGYGYKTSSGEVEGIYTKMLADLDQMAFTFASHFNLVHDTGWSPNEIRNNAKSPSNPFFSLSSTTNPTGAAASLKVSQSILDNPDNIAAAAEGNVIAGVFERNTVNASTVGNPVITGIYDKSIANAEKIKIDLVYEDAINGWKYTATGYDTSGNAITPTTTGNFTSTTVDILGVTLDTSHVKSQSPNDTWSFEFNAQGVKSSDDAFIGNGSNALKLANVKDAVLSYGGSLTNVQSFYQGMIGSLGDNASEANRMSNVAGVLKESVDQKRLSLSSVSLDEEMTNMIKFQHAYNAAARNITLVDEMLDKIINGMGVGGR